VRQVRQGNIGLQTKDRLTVGDGTMRVLGELGRLGVSRGNLIICRICRFG
jgi:hypothetical protein